MNSKVTTFYFANQSIEWEFFKDDQRNVIGFGIKGIPESKGPKQDCLGLIFGNDNGKLFKPNGIYRVSFFGFSWVGYVFLIVLIQDVVTGIETPGFG